MIPVFVVVLIIIASTIAIASLVKGAEGSVWQFQASLARKLPPDVQTEMKPKLLNPTSVLTWAAIVFLMFRSDLDRKPPTSRPTHGLNFPRGEQRLSFG